jgi:hypothetical protein
MSSTQNPILQRSPSSHVSSSAQAQPGPPGGQSSAITQTSMSSTHSSPRSHVPSRVQGQPGAPIQQVPPEVVVASVVVRSSPDVVQPSVVEVVSCVLAVISVTEAPVDASPVEVVLGGTKSVVAELDPGSEVASTTGSSADG